jgi:hypothetical protein
MARRKKSGKKVKRPSKGSNGMKPYAQMLADPCSSVLVPGLHTTDEGILGRLKTSFSTSYNLTNGYVLWAPHYVGEANGPDARVNLIFFTTSTPNIGPLNTTVDPYGSGPNGNSPEAIALSVGASAFVMSTTVSDFRLLSACMRVMYTGSMQSSAGVIALLENVPADTLLLGDAGNPASVTQLFSMSSKTKRIGVDVNEVIYRPNSSISGTFKSDRDSVFHVGNSAVTALTSESLRFSPTMFGFAWQGLDSSQLLFEFIQNIEWRPESSSGYVQTIPRQLSQPGLVPKVLKYLDDNFPGWTTSLKHATSYGARAAISAFTGQAPLRLGF